MYSHAMRPAAPGVAPYVLIACLLFLPATAILSACSRIPTGGKAVRTTVRGGNVTKETVVSIVTPVTSRGSLLPTYAVASRERGDCGKLSPVVSGATVPVYECAVVSEPSYISTYLACWYLSSGRDGYHIAVCIDAPWSSSVHEVVTKLLPNMSYSSDGFTSRDYPWAVELASGAHCIGNSLPEIPVSNMTLSYVCGNGKTGLFGPAQTRTQEWTFVSAVEGQDHVWTIGPTVPVRQAWYGGPIKGFS